MNRAASMVERFWAFIFTGNYRKSVLFVFTGAFILRAHTLFIDFIHIDVVTSYIIARRDLAGLEFSPNKGWLNHLLMKWSIKLFGDSLHSFHFTGILFILLTMLFVLLLGRKIYNTGTGIAGAMLYGFIISSYNTEFTATNGEVLYNLFFMAAFYFSYLLLTEKKMVAVPFIILSVWFATGIKFQGILCVPAILAYIVLAKPFYIRNLLISPRRYYGILVLFFLAALLFLVADWNFLHVVFNDRIKEFITPMLGYVSNRGFNPFMIIGKLLLRSFHFLLYHSIIWVPGTFAIIHFFSSEKRDEGTAYLVVLTVFLFFCVFLGGARLSVHYFIPVLPTLSILAAHEFYRRFISSEDMKVITIMFVIPVFFFFSWNVKDALTRNFFPELKQSEGKFAEYFRIIFLASHGEYLLPHKSILPAIEYVRNNTPPDARIISWPMGTEMVYYTGRYSADDSYWYNEGALYAIVQREQGNTAVFDEYQKLFVRHIEKTSPDCFIDVSSTEMIRKVMVYRKKTDSPFYFDWNSVPMFRFGSFASLDDFPDVVNYLNRNYTYAGRFGESRIWMKKK